MEKDFFSLNTNNNNNKTKQNQKTPKSHKPLHSYINIRQNSLQDTKHY